MIDQAALLAHIAAKTKQFGHKPAIAAVLDVLAAAIKRGDFEKKERKS